MTHPNFRLSPAASRQRHHDAPQAYLLVGAMLGAVAVTIIIAVVILVTAAQ